METIPHPFSDFNQLHPDYTFEDRSLGEYALGQVTSEANASNHLGHESFSEVIENLQNQIGENEVIDYGKLRDYGKSNRLDYAAYFKPPEGMLGTIGSRIIPVLVKARHSSFACQGS